MKIEVIMIAVIFGLTGMLMENLFKIEQPVFYAVMGWAFGFVAGLLQGYKK